METCTNFVIYTTDYSACWTSYVCPIVSHFLYNERAIIGQECIYIIGVTVEVFAENPQGRNFHPLYLRVTWLRLSWRVIRRPRG